MAAQERPDCSGRIRFEVISFLHSRIRAEIVLDIPIVISRYLKLSSPSFAVSRYALKAWHS